MVVIKVNDFCIRIGITFVRKNLDLGRQATEQLELPEATVSPVNEG